MIAVGLKRGWTDNLSFEEFREWFRLRVLIQGVDYTFEWGDMYDDVVAKVYFKKEEDAIAFKLAYGFF